MVKQARFFKPDVVALYDEEAAQKARKNLRGTGIAVRDGIDGLLETATVERADTVVSAIVGAAGVMPTFAAVEAGKVIALANKEALVAAGKVITAEAKRSGSKIIPIDSEHSAIFQSLLGQDRSAVRRIILTASGGPFFGKGNDLLTRVTPQMALDHPKWKMGPKVTVDSATMMNKGLEVIEARWIFDIPAERIEVLIHPQSVVHSMVEFTDGSTLAQMGQADMRIPISFALSFPKRVDLGLEPLDFAAVGNLEFFCPEPDLFPCLDLAFEALRRDGGIPAVMNAANEIAVEAFLDGRLAFTAIPMVVQTVMNTPLDFDYSTLSGILRGDQMAREATRALIEQRRETQ
jgi:1-deoxy-D-xylulose-5-phosphate reductoisomerase